LPVSPNLTGVWKLRGLPVALGLLLLTACGQRTLSLAPTQTAAHFAPLEVRVVLTPSEHIGGLAVAAYADGSSPPAPVVLDVSGNAGCSPDVDRTRTCTVALSAPVGLDDVSVRGYTLPPAAGKPAGDVRLNGTVLRDAVAPERNNVLGVTFAGKLAAWLISPRRMLSQADGQPHDVPFAVAPADAHGNVILAAQRVKPEVAVSGDPLGTVALDGPQTQGSTAYELHYSGAPLAQAGVSAASPGVTAGEAHLTPLSATPQTLDIDAGKPATLSVSLARSRGPFSATVSGNCSVAPAQATAPTAGAAVTFRLTGQSVGACGVKLLAPGEAVALAPEVALKVRVQIGVSIGPPKIKHIVVLFEENRSFDSIFGGLDSKGKPFPGADTVSNPLPGEPTPHDHNGNPVTMVAGSLNECYDPNHNLGDGEGDIDGGKMDGFDLEKVETLGCAQSTPGPDYPYRYVAETEVDPYWKIGEKYAISDRMFEPVNSSSFTPHLFMVSGQSARTIDDPAQTPWGCDSGGGNTVDVYNEKTGGVIVGEYPCFNVPTLADVLDQRGVSWHYYATDKSDFGYEWSAYDAFNQIRNGPDWSSDVTTPPAQLIADVQNGTLAAMTWVTPTLATSDHPSTVTDTGPAWVTTVVNAIGKSQFWDQTAIFVTWDDWGGFYDHVPPTKINVVGLGLRVPLIVVSPYVRPKYVSHNQHTTGSILHFAEEMFDLPSLGTEDARADDLQDVFDFTQKPTKFKSFKVPKSNADVLRAAASSNQPGYVGNSDAAERGD
jgi:phospholipase C